MEAKVIDNQLFIALDGRIDTNNAAQVEKEILGFLAENAGKTPVFDAARLEYISSAGLRVLMKVRKQAKKSTSVEQFKTIMEQEHHITVKESRGRWSYLPEGRERAITWRKLGEAYKKEAIEAAIAANLQRKNEHKAQAKQPQPEQEYVLGPLPTQEEMPPLLRRISMKHPSQSSTSSHRKSTASRSRMKISSSTGASLTSTVPRCRRVTACSSGRRYKTLRKTPAGLPTSPKMAC